LNRQDDIINYQKTHDRLRSAYKKRITKSYIILKSVISHHIPVLHWLCLAEQK